MAREIHGLKGGPRGVREARHTAEAGVLNEKVILAVVEGECCEDERAVFRVREEEVQQEPHKREKRKRDLQNLKPEWRMTCPALLKKRI